MKSADNLFDKYREEAIGHGLGSCGAMDETRDHCLELIAPAVAPGEAGEIASGMVGAELARPCCINHRTSAEYPYP